ncbi:putative DD41D transposase [Trichonephila clavipes]|uniref:Putative DD41D transposase n=1 Tax=Trichonephila clavipes TaxID=2585209 RepID=A0A8X6WJD8_TRICX|nr:putative DD41D transposase [Trichonephila clavipes]
MPAMIRYLNHWVTAAPSEFRNITGNRDYTGMWVRLGSTNLMAGKVVFLWGLLSPIRIITPRSRFVEWTQNKIAVVPDFHKRILFSDEAHFWLNGYVNKQNCRIWSETNPQVYVETPLHPEKLTVWCVLWAGGILLQKR